MKLSEEQLNKIYERKDRLGAFLDDCAVVIFSSTWESVYYAIADLPDQEIIDLVDWWKKKQSEQKYILPIGTDSDGGSMYLTPDEDGVGIYPGERPVKYTKAELARYKEKYPKLANLIDEVKKEVSYED